MIGERYPEAKKYLVDACICEMKKLIKDGSYDFLIIPIALINDYCNIVAIYGMLLVKKKTGNAWECNVNLITNETFSLAERLQACKTLNF